MRRPGQGRPDRSSRPRGHADGRRAAFRAWRHSRPFWGGLLLVLAGVELLAIPLSGVLLKGALKLVIYIGIGGVFGVLIGALLIAAGIMLWVNPAHRVFYGVAGIVLGILSFPASNLGGLFIAMLLGIIGGALAFAWGQVDAVPATGGNGDPTRGPEESPAGIDLVTGTPEAPGGPKGEGGAPEAPDGPDGEGGAPGEPRRPGVPARPEAKPRDWRFRGRGGRRGTLRGTRGHRAFAVATMPALLVAGMLGTSAHAAAPQSDDGCILGIICLPGPSPSPSPSPPTRPSSPAPKPTPSPACPSVSPSPSPSPSPTPVLIPLPSPSCSPSPSPGGGGPPVLPSIGASAGASPSPGATGSHAGKPGSGNGGKPGKKTARKARPARQVADPGLTAPSARSVLNAGSATLTNFTFKGIVNMPVGGGGRQKMMEFTASSATLAGGVTVTVRQDGQTTVTTSPTLGFSGGMTLYATRLCGKLAGVPLCFTPSTVSAVLLSIANLLTGVLPITMTNVTTDQPLALAGGLRTGPLSIGG